MDSYQSRYFGPEELRRGKLDEWLNGLINNLQKKYPSRSEYSLTVVGYDNIDGQLSVTVRLSESGLKPK